MVKSVFIGLGLPKKDYQSLDGIGANHLIISENHINDEKWGWLEKTNAQKTISIGSFEHGGCPLDPQGYLKLEKKINLALRREVSELWFDHFRFDGRWEAVDVSRAPAKYEYQDLHTGCQWCKGKNRAQEMARLANRIRQTVPQKIKIGYFAIPYHLEKHTGIVNQLGQDHSLLSQHFNLVSPMLYVRMFNLPSSYISDYVKYLADIVSVPILPIIQIKDMPDRLPDQITFKMFLEFFSQAIQGPSLGVSVFYWAHAIEKNKTDWIRKVFSS